MKQRCVRRNPGMPTTLRISEMGYPQRFTLYGGSGRIMLDALVAADVRVPLFLFMVMQDEFAKDPARLKLFMEIGPGFLTLFIERKGYRRDLTIGRTISPMKLTKAQIAAFTNAGMRKFSPYRVDIDL